MDFSVELTSNIPYLRRSARALCGDASRADDLVQDCIERAINKCHLYDPGRPMRPWLYTMLRNIFISDLRKNNRSAVVKSLDELGQNEGQARPEQENNLSVVLIADALDLLPTQQREVVVLVGLEQMSYRDVAEIIGVPIGTVMSRLSRGRRQLEEILQQRGHAFLRRVK